MFIDVRDLSRRLQLRKKIRVSLSSFTGYMRIAKKDAYVMEINREIPELYLDGAIIRGLLFIKAIDSIRNFAMLPVNIRVLDKEKLFRKFRIIDPEYQLDLYKYFSRNMGLFIEWFAYKFYPSLNAVRFTEILNDDEKESLVMFEAFRNDLLRRQYRSLRKSMILSRELINTKYKLNDYYYVILGEHTNTEIEPITDKPIKIKLIELPTTFETYIEQTTNTVLKILKKFLPSSIARIRIDEEITIIL